MHYSLPELAQAAHVRAAAHASGSGGGPQADPPLVTSWATLTYGTDLPSGPWLVVPLPLFLFFSPLYPTLTSSRDDLADDLAGDLFSDLLSDL